MVNLEMRRWIVSTVAIIIASFLLVAGVTQYQGTNWEVVRAVYVSAAGVVFILGLLPWAWE